MCDCTQDRDRESQRTDPERRIEEENVARLINIGFGNMVSSARVIAIVSPESAPIKRIIQEAKDKGTLIDATYGRRTRAVLIMDSDHVVLSAVAPETVGGRAAVDEEDDDNV